MRRYLKYFQKRYWETKSKKAPHNKGYKALAILSATVEGFFTDKCFDKAATLTFYSLLSIIPLLAIGFGIAQSFGGDEMFAEQIQTQLKSQPAIADKILEFANATLKQTRGGLIAGVGFVFLLWTVLRMIGNVEAYFNEIWKVKVSRSLWSQVKCYLPLIFLFPLFLVTANATVIFISTASLLSSQLLFLLPYLLTWFLLAFVYKYLPNAPVSTRAALFAGLITALIFHVWQSLYVIFQTHATSYGVIYGSFAAIPLFLLWLNYSWLIVFFGAELTYHTARRY